MRAADLLEDGKVDEAKAELDQALALDGGNRIAASLQKQLTADPVATLGKESFSYTVRPGDTLSRIAQRFLNDLYMFHILARYNGIDVPKQLHAGQVIRIPGKARPPEAPPPEAPRAERPEPPKPPAAKPPEKPPVEPTPAPKPEPPPVSPGETAYQGGLQALKAGDREKALALFNQALKADSGHAEARAKAGQVKTELAQRYHRDATAAFHRQDLQTAIRLWDRVLELDPNHKSAQLNRAKAIELQQIIEQKSRSPGS